MNFFRTQVMVKSAYTLIGDLGGTNCRLRLMEIIVGRDDDSNDEVLHEKRFSSRDFDSLESILVTFLRELHIDIKHKYYPELVVMCVAGPVSAVQRQVGQRIENGNIAFSTNLRWEMSSFVISDTLNIPHEYVTIVNDFEAVGYGTLGLKEHQFVQLTSGRESRSHAPIAVIGPGTGLGEAYLTTERANQLYHVHPSEGGHSTYAPTCQIEFDLMNYIQEEFGGHVSWERVCSGTGVKSIYRFCKHLEDPTNRFYIPSNTDIYTTKPTIEQEPILGEKHPSQAIFDGAKQGNPLLVKVVHLFVLALGRETGNLAASLLPFGGIFIAGGIGPKIRWALEPPRDKNGVSTITYSNDPAIPEPLAQEKVDSTLFLRTVHCKGRLQSTIRDVPVYLVLIDEIGLIGCIYVAKRIGRKILNSRL